MNLKLKTMEARIFQLNCSSGGVPKLAVREADVTELGMVGDAHAFPDIHDRYRAIGNPVI